MAAITEIHSVVSNKSSIELKGASFTLPVIRLLEADVDAISRDLADKITEAPQFFENAPVVIDVRALRGKLTSVDLALLVGQLRRHRLIPVGISGGDDEQNEISTTMELAVLSQGARVSQRAAPRPVREPEDGTRLVVETVRSGQRVCAPNGDLIVLGSVSPGAELFAQGNVHIYGVLRGRALAGIKGDQQARIFCQRLEAELVSVAGNYRVSEDIDAGPRGRAVQIYLDDEKLIIEAL